MVKALYVAAACLCWIFSANAATLADPPRVVASIKPVHSLVAAVMDGVGIPALLIHGGGSPHASALRPSEAQMLQEADVVFWIGEALEGFLAKPLQTLPHNAHVVALQQADGLTLLSSREGGAWEAEAHDHRYRPEPAQPHEAFNNDMHIWLDPVNAQAMATAIADTLRQVDPQNEEKYAANAAALRQRLSNLDARLRDQLAPVRDMAFIVFHDAYQYLERRYGLNVVGALTVTPERLPSVQRLQDIRARIIETGVKCVFSEPQFEPVLIRTIVGGTGAQTGVLDPLGAELAPGPEAYFTLMEQLARSLRDCLDDTH